jgi:hypothetical protein
MHVLTRCVASLPAVSAHHATQLQLPSLHDAHLVLLLGALMSAAYCIIAMAMSATVRPGPEVNYNPAAAHRSPVERVMGIFNALTTVLFAYGGHNVALEIQATIPIGGKYPLSTVQRMMRGVNVTFVVTGACWCVCVCVCVCVCAGVVCCRHVRNERSPEHTMHAADPLVDMALAPPLRPRPPASAHEQLPATLACPSWASTPLARACLTTCCWRLSGAALVGGGDRQPDGRHARGGRVSGVRVRGSEARLCVLGMRTKRGR